MARKPAYRSEELKTCIISIHLQAAEVTAWILSNRLQVTNKIILVK